MKLRGWKMQVRGGRLKCKAGILNRECGEDSRCALDLTIFFHAFSAKMARKMPAPHAGYVHSASTKEDFSDAIDFFIEAFQVTDRIL